MVAVTGIWLRRRGRAHWACLPGTLALEPITNPDPTRAVLADVSIRLRRGGVTALVGHSGAGKSTVAALISRFYEPDAGRITLGGAPAGAFTRGEWARAVALVSQEPILFAGGAAALGCRAAWQSLERRFSPWHTLELACRGSYVFFGGYEVASMEASPAGASGRQRGMRQI